MPHSNQVQPGFIRAFALIANFVSRQAGRPVAFGLAAATVIIWLLTGPYYGYSDTWQLIINTGTTIVTFLMVFLIQNSQNRDNAAIQVKLDELIRSGAAQNFYVGLEHMTDEEIEEIRKKCEARAKGARGPAGTDHSPPESSQLEKIHVLRPPGARGSPGA
jgi:low affinity Fe/Cu permease